MNKCACGCGINVSDKARWHAGHCNKGRVKLNPVRYKIACRNCNLVFESIRNRKKFCSPKCSQKWLYDNGLFVGLKVGHELKRRSKGTHRPEVSREKHYRWAGGVYEKERTRIQGTIEYKNFRRSVIDRDKKCMVCDSVNELEVHHIKPFKRFPDMRFDPYNGVLICKPCHLHYHSMNGK